jgi:hypothetical protein
MQPRMTAACNLKRVTNWSRPGMRTAYVLSFHVSRLRNLISTLPMLPSDTQRFHGERQANRP